MSAPPGGGFGTPPRPGGSGEPCAEKAGFLFSHHCRRPSTARCGKCSRPVCAKHQVTAAEGAVCISCGKKAQRRQRRQRDDDHYYDDSPYFYTSYYYSGYGYYGPGTWGHSFYDDPDPNDFSEADGASLHASSGDWDDDFEHDMGAS